MPPGVRTERERPERIPCGPRKTLCLDRGVVTISPDAHLSLEHVSCVHSPFLENGSDRPHPSLGSGELRSCLCQPGVCSDSIDIQFLLFISLLSNTVYTEQPSDANREPSSSEMC